MPDEHNVPAISVSDIDSAPDSAVVVADDQHVTLAKYQAAFLRVSNEKEALLEELNATRKRVQTTEILDKLLEPMAKRAFAFMCVYCGFVGGLVALHGLKAWGFALPESVLQFLVGSTATTVIGLVGMVLTGIFVGARKGGRD